MIPKTRREGGSLETTWFQLGFHTVLGNLQLMASRSLIALLFVLPEKKKGFWEKKIKKKKGRKDNGDDRNKDVQPGA